MRSSPLGLWFLPPGCSRKGWRRRSPLARTNELGPTGQSWWASSLPSYHAHRILLKAKPCHTCVLHKSGDKGVHAGSSGHQLRLTQQSKPKDGVPPADVSHFAVLEVWCANAIKKPYEAVCQGLRHIKDEQGFQALSAVRQRYYPLILMPWLVERIGGWSR